MGMTDPIADMFARIRNGLGGRLDIVEVPHSATKERIAEILLAEGFLGGVHVGKRDAHKFLYLKLRYTDENKPLISELKRVSKPGRRVYVKHDRIPAVVSGFGIAILSTSRGMMTNVAARKARVGGELVGTVW
ncbi:MAG: 30S ribosomal protein S8 [Deltaproteobacteria bacterium]|nr:30S ribosomal protein S8 [Deltaproteobacteria bacterium]